MHNSAKWASVTLAQIYRFVPFPDQRFKRETRCCRHHSLGVIILPVGRVTWGCHGTQGRDRIRSRPWMAKKLSASRNPRCAPAGRGTVGSFRDERRTDSDFVSVPSGKSAYLME